MFPIQSIVASFAALAGTMAPLVYAQRPMERLSRGVVAVRSSDNDVFVSWRYFGLDSEVVGFNVYRSSGGSTPERINEDVITGGTNFVDSSSDLGVDSIYHVRAVTDGEEGEGSASFTLSANHAIEPLVRIPLENTGFIQYVWVGDLNGDGDYDYIVDRTSTSQSIEAYTSTGELLWSVDLGPNSENQNNISPGSTAISVGHWDGVTVYDFDSDGRAEVAIRIANGVTFGDGETFQHSNDEEQWVAFLDGETGALRAQAPIPTDAIANGPLAARFGVGYLDGETPHLVAYMKNRASNGDFALIYAAYTFDGTSANMEWKWVRDAQDRPAPDGHNMRIIDADGDGIDEIHDIGFVLNGDGSMKYSLGEQGVVHGDRFYVTKIDPDRAGLQGFGVQQDNPSALSEYYYDASTGEMIWEHYGDEPADVGRALVGDIDPTQPGMEVWSFGGVYNARDNQRLYGDGEQPWPQMTVFWDGDDMPELFNDGKLEKWNHEAPTPTNSVPRIFRTDQFGGSVKARGSPSFLGDIIGDWREELVLTNADNTELLVFTTNEPTDIRLYTLAHNPAYRNDMTLKGYMQSHNTDYFMGSGMEIPPQPNIYYVGV